MGEPSDDELQLHLGGEEDESACEECLAADRVHYASSVAEAVVVFANRLTDGETEFMPKDLLGLVHHFMEMLERFERGTLCEECFRGLRDGDD